MRKYGSNSNNCYCFMAVIILVFFLQQFSLFYHYYYTMNPHMYRMKDVWWVYGCPKNDLILKTSMCHYLSQETTLSLRIVNNNYVGDSKSRIYLMVGCSDITPVCDLEVYITSKQYSGYPWHMIYSKCEKTQSAHAHIIMAQFSLRLA